MIFSSADIVLAGITFVLFAIQLFYYLIVYTRPYRAQRRGSSLPATERRPPVSIIVYARNESFNLQRHLPRLLEQDYPEFEVIVINDGSTDETDNVLRRFEHEHPNLYHTFIPQESKYLSRRKLSLTLGIKAARHEHLLFIEANCRPVGTRWIQYMVRGYAEQTAIVPGFCAYRANTGLLHKLVAYDNLMTGLQYLSSALAGHPYSGSGRNLSYRKELFFKHKGYSKSLNLHAGDDDLFINTAATPANTRTEYAPESITEMAAIERFGVWKEMKASRAATQQHYRGRQTAFYRVETLASVLFQPAVLCSLIAGSMGNPLVSLTAAALYLVLFTAKAIVLARSARMLLQPMHAAWLPLLETLRCLVNCYVYIYRFFRGKKDYTFTLGNGK